MSRKDYVAIAAAIRLRIGIDYDQHAAHGIARQLAGVFESDNPRFDSTRFIEAAIGGTLKD